MPKRIMPLTDIQVRTAKPQEKAYKMADGGALYLLVNQVAESCGDLITGLTTNAKPSTLKATQMFPSEMPGKNVTRGYYDKSLLNIPLARLILPDQI